MMTADSLPRVWPVLEISFGAGAHLCSDHAIKAHRKISIVKAGHANSLSFLESTQIKDYRERTS